MFRKIALALAAAATLATAGAAIPTQAEARDDGWRSHQRHNVVRHVNRHKAVKHVHRHKVVRHVHHRHVWRPTYRSNVVVRYSAPSYAYAPYCFTKKKWVQTYYGWRVKRVRVCR
jgi:hypothetical protein